ncbi:MAG: thioredoxin fold domain-containing protein [Candidatus Thiodiazotropha sp. (ex Myrtea sp. 'scaly one' KF741663)]|nr:thioredoxin fold domain-containing protein [Candidatus Thiodiazotropha sp. (ex Myrtea sp. 'scaly one' KF741663)]
MIRLCTLLALWGLSAGLLAVEGSAGLEKGLINPGFHEKPTWFKHSFLDLQEDVSEAADAGKRVILFFHQDGCPYCAKLLNENFTLKEIVEKTKDNFQVIEINIWGDNEVTDLDGKVTTEKDLAASLKVIYTPTLLFLDEQGRTVLRINGYFPPHKFSTALDYVAEKQETKQRFRDYLASRQPVAASGKLHREPGFLQLPYDLRADSRKDGKPLLVLMEMKQCPPCDELHQEVLKRPELQQALGEFDVALVDVWSSDTLINPSGEHVSATDWAANLRINYAPSLLFFDEQGREIFRSEAYLKAFHTHAVMDYITTGSYRDQPNFQRFVQSRADHMREQGIAVDLME